MIQPAAIGEGSRTQISTGFEWHESQFFQIISTEIKSVIKESADAALISNRRALQYTEDRPSHAST